MQLNLNIYNGREVEKVYTANEFDIMFGTVEDLIELIDVDKFSGGATDLDFITAIATLLKGGMEQVKSLLKELFPEVTEEELKRTKVREVLEILMQVLKYGFSNMAGAGGSKK